MTDRKKIKALFQDALELEAAERKRFLDALDEPTREEVDALLAAHEEAGGFLAAAAPRGEAPGDVIGPYKLLQQIGEGGFGVVYMAEQEEPVRRKVALKIIRLGMDSRQVIARFEVERQALALMDHPNIAKVLDAGATKAGRPFFVMELVKGIPITEYCDQASLNTGERLELFQQVCLAVQHAHQKGIIHRDIKPSNILVTLHDGRPVPKVIDFGIAKATNQRLTEKTLFTEFRQMIGTPEYMAPEQAELSGLDVDTRADIYSLGVLLYELLTGTKPFDLRSLLEAGYEEMLRHIREVDPPKPSTRVSTSDELPTIAARRHTQPRLLGRELRGDLDWIVMKALEKDRTRRYETANAFAMDLGRYLTDQAVLASPPSALYRARKFVRRNRVGVLAGAVVAGGLAAGLALAAAGFLQARSERDRAQSEAKRANTVSALIESLFASWDPNAVKGANYPARDLLHELDLRFRTADDEPAVEARLRRVAGNAYRQLGIPDKAEPHLRRAQELGRELYDEDHEFLLDNQHAWAWLLHDKGDFEGSAAAFRELIDRRPGSAPYRGLADVLVELARYEEAERAGRKALELARNDDERDVAKVALAWVLHCRGRYAEAEPLAREALASRERRLGEDHPAIAIALNTLGMVLAASERREEAETCYRRALKIWEHAYGRLDEGILRNLANVRLTLGHEMEAEELFRAAVDSCRARLGRNHRMTAAALVDLGDARRFQADFEGAHALYSEALAILEATIGRNNVEYVETVRALAQAKERLGLYEEALGLQHELVSLREKFFGNRSRPVSDAIHNLAMTLSELGREKEALRYQRRAIAIYEELGIEDDLSLANKLNGLGVLLSRTGPFDEAEAALKRALALRVKHLGRVHDYVATMHNNLGILYQARNQLDHAAASYEEAIAILQELHGGEHFDMALSLGNLGTVKLDQEDYAAAIRYLERSLALRRTHLGPDHPETATCLHHLAIAHGVMGRTEKALEYGDETLRIRRAKLGPHQRETLRTLRARGRILLIGRRYAEAIEPLREACAHWPRKDGREAVAGKLFLSFALRCAGEAEESNAILEEVRKTAAPVEAAGVLEEIAYYLGQHGRFPEAERAARAALYLAGSRPGFEGLTATLQFRLATVLDSAGKPEEAEELLKKTLATRRRLEGEKSSAVASTLAAWASVRQSQGDLPEADRLLTRAIEIERELHGDDYVELPVLLNNLASIRMMMGRFDAAEKLIRDALARSRKIFGGKSQHNAMLLAHLAEVRMQRGDAKQAVSLYEEALALHGDDPDVGNAEYLAMLSAYGAALRATGELKEAKEACEKALRGFLAFGQPETPQVLWCRQNLGWVCHDRKEWHRVEELALANRAAAERLGGRATAAWVQSSYLLSWAYLHTDRVELEEKVMREVLAVTRGVQGYPPVALARDVVRLAHVLVRRKKFAEAERLSREATTIREQHLPPDHWLVFSARCMLGRALAGQRKFEEAEELLLANYPKLDPPPNVQWAKTETREAIVRMYEDWGKPEKAAQWRE